MFLIGIIVLLGIVILSAILRVSYLFWSLTLVLLSLFFILFLSAFWSVLLIVWLPLMVPAIRTTLFSKRVFHWLKTRMPPMSQTEQDAIAAGDVWWDAELFSGRPNWKKLHGIAKPILSAEEQFFLDNETEQLCQLLDSWKIIHEDYDLSPEAWQFLKDKRFFAMVIKKEYGGLEFSAIAHSAIISKIATRSPVAAVTAMVPNSLGPAELLMRYGTDKQRHYYLPRLAQGLEIPCFALTGLYAGSDAASLPDYGVVCEGEHQGQRVLGIKLSWDKRYITLAPVATILGLAFHLYDPEHLLGQQNDIGITLALIPTAHPGVEIGMRHYPAFMPFMNGPTSGRDVFIPLDFIIGGQARLGQGWRMLMECLSIGRAISLPAMAISMAKLTYRMTGAYSRIRSQFNVPIAKFEGVEAALARIAGFTYLIEATRLTTAHAVDLGLSPTIVSAIAKYHTTEMSRVIINDAMDIHGGKGIQMGPKNYLVSAYVGIPVSITVEGANILTRNLIIFGQGIMRCHPVLLKEMEALQKPESKTSLKQFDRMLVTHVGFILSNLMRTLFFGITGCRLMKANVSSQLAVYYKQLTRFSSALALVSDMALLSLGGALKRKEAISARLGDVLSYLYMASCALKYFKDNGEQRDEEAYVHWVLKYCLYQVQTALNEVFDNYPIRWMGRLLRVIVMPYGKRFKKPSDRLGHALIAAMTEPSAFRGRLTAGCFIGASADDPVGMTERALQTVISAETVLQKFKKIFKDKRVKPYQTLEEQVNQAVAINALSEEEAILLKSAQQAIAEVIAVDAFEKDYFK